VWPKVIGKDDQSRKGSLQGSGVQQAVFVYTGIDNQKKSCEVVEKREDSSERERHQTGMVDSECWMANLRVTPGGGVEHFDRKKDVR